MAQNIVQEMAASLRSSKAQLEVVNAQLLQLDRQKKLAQVTAKELDSYPVEQVWRSCGKAFVLQDRSKYTEDLGSDEKLVEEQLKSMKIKQNYLQTTVDNTVESIRRVIEQN
ncbi:LANO_0G03840g1_1 [Lachancea nothofagi CBS 11611]|uniref:LANO_0G03840g1_1 n=1 Tax=Lachancea nothofagi CBS 11611 TaxID=1266666 RepID=A0A1G4KFP2_9SACH|nr:LANO_0G03840g1_1 [Lachancea nothofagi CBS 11611]